MYVYICMCVCVSPSILSFMVNGLCLFICYYFKSSLEDMFIDFGERQREGERERAM